MQIPENYEAVKPSTFTESNNPLSGAYVMGILNAEETTSKNGNPMLILTLDIAKGEFKNYYSELSIKIGKCCRPKIYQLTNRENIGYLKGMIISIEESNPGFKFNFDEKTLIRKLVGVMMREEEYINKDGEIKTILKPLYTCSVKRVETGELKVPETKRIKQDNAGFINSPQPEQNDSDLPF